MDNVIVEGKSEDLIKKLMELAVWGGAEGYTIKSWLKLINEINSICNSLMYTNTTETKFVYLDGKAPNILKKSAAEECEVCYVIELTPNETDVGVKMTESIKDEECEESYKIVTYHFVKTMKNEVVMAIPEGDEECTYEEDAISYIDDDMWDEEDPELDDWDVEDDGLTKDDVLNGGYDVDNSYDLNN